MGWNEPGHDRDPWGGGGDVDELLRRLKRQLTRRFRGGLGGPRTRGPRLWWLGPIALLLVWLLTGFYDVPAGSRAVLLHFGAYAGVEGTGVHWHWPWPIAADRVVNVTEQRSLSERQTVLTADGRLASIELTVDYRVTDPYAYLFAASSPTGVLSALAGSALTASVRMHSLRTLRDGSGNLSGGLEKRLAGEVAQLKLGVDVGSARLTHLTMPQVVTEAQAKRAQHRKQAAAAAASARAAARVAFAHARSKAHTLVAAAQSAAAARVARAHEDVARFQALLPAWRRAPEETEQMLRNEAVREVLAAAPKVIVSGPVHVVSIPPWSGTASKPVRAHGSASARAPATASAGKGGRR